MTTRHAPASVGGRAVAYGLAVAVQGTALLLILPITTRLLGPEEYGRIAIALAVTQVGTVVATAGLPLAVTRAWFRTPDGPHQARATLGLLATVSALLVALALVLGLALGYTQDPLFVATAMALLGISLTSGGQGAFRAEGRVGRFILAALGMSVAAHLAGIAAVLTASRTSTVYMTAFASVCLATGCWTLVAARASLPWHHRDAMVRAVRFGLPLMPHMVAILLLGSGDPLLVGRSLGLSEAADYQVAMLIGMAPIAMLQGINNAWLPYALAADPGERTPVLARSSGVVVTLTGSIVVALCLLAAPLAAVATSPEFDRQVIAAVTPIIALCSLAYALYLSFVKVLMLTETSRPLAVITPLAAGIVLVAADPVMGLLGLPGMGAVKVIGYCVLAAGTWVAARRVMQVPWPWSRFAAASLAGVFAAVSVQFVTRPSPIWWLQIGLAGCVLAGTALWLRRVMHQFA